MSRRAVSRWILDRIGWEVEGDPPPDPVVMMVAAPHTSNWDFALMVLLTWSTDVEPHVLVKKEAFRGPVGPVLRRLGGVPVDRQAPRGMVEDLVERAGTSKHLSLIITPEGTRSAREYWKSGFYRIARQGDMPVCLAYCDAANKRMGFGPVLHLTGDVAADMDTIRAFYADKTGVRPDRATAPRLREEESAAASPDPTADEPSS